MARKSKAIDPKNQLRIGQVPGESNDYMEAKSAQSPIHANAQTTRIFSRGTFGDSGLTESVEVLTDKVAKVVAGDLSGAEAMLTAQATALDAIFTEMARRAALNMGEYLAASDTYMRLALKAQSQCRTTLEALAEIKNPRSVAFVKQANIAHGPQQVNNAPTHAGNTINPPNELSGVSHELLSDTRASQAASRINTPLETVGEVHRATN